MMINKISTLGALLLLSLIAVISCKKQEPETIIVQEKRGYICVNNSCQYVEDGAQYVTLLDCKSVCADKRPGTATIKSTFVYSYSYSVTTSFAYTADDVAIGAFFHEQSDVGNSNNFQNVKTFECTKGNLLPGTYYYQVKLFTYSSSYPTYKTGVFTIKPGETNTLELTM
jgi:hypothetical protein